MIGHGEDVFVLGSRSRGMSCGCVDAVVAISILGDSWWRG